MPRMDARFAENLVRYWQNVKSQALGPDHSLGILSEVRIFYLYQTFLQLLYANFLKLGLWIAQIIFFNIFSFARSFFCTISLEPSNQTKCKYSNILFLRCAARIPFHLLPQYHHICISTTFEAMR